MNKYKLIIADYDGTLAGRDFIIPKVTQNAIKKWIDSGRLFSIASGRQYLMLKKDAIALALTTPLITRGGAEIVDAKTGTILFSEHIDKETVKELLEILKHHTDKIAVEKDDVIYSTFQFFGDFPEIKRKGLEDFELTDVPKLMVKAEGDQLASLEKAMEEMVKKFSGLHMVRSYTPLGSGWDITSIKATKHLAVLELIKELGINPAETVGVGDGYNDFPLLEACGLKIAMEDAPYELKAIADFVVPGYKENGVAVLIEKLLTQKA